MKRAMETKVCTKCQQNFPLSEFYSYKPGYYRSKCKSCYNKNTTRYREENREKIIAREIRYRMKNREKECTRAKEYREKNHEKAIFTSRKWAEKNPERVKYYSRKHRLKYYGITIKDYNRMFMEQKGCCAICGKHQSEQKNTLAVDHDHKTGEVRSLLCSRCNSQLGWYEKLKANIESYLEKETITLIKEA